MRLRCPVLTRALSRLNDHAVRGGAAFAGRGTCRDQRSDGSLQGLKLDHAHVWVTWLAVAVVITAWAWIIWQWQKTRRPIARTTVTLMIAASLLTVAASSWPWTEPTVFKTLGIVKKKAVSQDG